MSHTTPSDVFGLSSGAGAVAAGGSHTCALTTVGGLKCWGYNANGQLGNGTTISSSVPLDVSGLVSGVAAVALGGAHTCALTIVGGVKCWGYNEYGQLGNGTTVDVSVPVDVMGLTTGAVAITAGILHTCAITTDGGLKCWGHNGSGAVGSGTIGNPPWSTTPVDVFGMTSGVSAVEGGGFHTCAIRGDSGLECWGSNGYGQVGDGWNGVEIAPGYVVKFLPEPGLVLSLISGLTFVARLARTRSPS